MKLGIDLHRVIDAKRDLFVELTKMIRECNEKLGHKHEVHILTGPRKEDLKLDDLAGIWYTHFFSIVDHPTRLTTI